MQLFLVDCSFLLMRDPRVHLRDSRYHVFVTSLRIAWQSGSGVRWASFSSRFDVSDSKFRSSASRNGKTLKFLWEVATPFVNVNFRSQVCSEIRLEMAADLANDIWQCESRENWKAEN